MLVLSRKQGERILIDDRIEVIVLRTRGNRVQLGIVAPSDVPIHRQELAAVPVDEEWISKQTGGPSPSPRAASRQPAKMAPLRQRLEGPSRTKTALVTADGAVQ